MEIRRNRADDTLKIRADKPHLANNRSIAVSYTITVPRRMNVLCDSDYGSLSVTTSRERSRARPATAPSRPRDRRPASIWTPPTGPSSAGTSPDRRCCSAAAAAPSPPTDLKGEAKIVTSYGSITCETFSGRPRPEDRQRQDRDLRRLLPRLPSRSPPTALSPATVSKATPSSCVGQRQPGLDGRRHAGAWICPPPTAASRPRRSPRRS